MKKYIFVILACLSISFSSLIVEAAAATGEYSYDGMGRIVLEKNMVNNVNTLTQDMFYKGDPGSRVPNTNTIFVIQNDFVLAEDITIPDGCVLKFDGGNIRGAYTITGNKTGIKAGLVKIFSTNVMFAGTWNVVEAYPEWFGAKGDGVTDDTNSIQKSIDFSQKVILTQIYKIALKPGSTNIINIPDKHSIIGKRVDFNTHNILIQEKTSCTVFDIGSYCSVEGLSIINSSLHLDQDIIGFNVNKKTNVKIGACVSRNLTIGFKLISITSNIESCFVTDCKHGFVTAGYSGSASSTSLKLNNCYVTNSRNTAYVISSLAYSCLINCSADYCALNGGYVYSITNSDDVSLYSCGCEFSPKCINVSGYATAIKICGCLFHLAQYNQATNNKAINIVGASFVQFDNVEITGTDIRKLSDLIYLDINTNYPARFKANAVLYLNNVLIDGAIIKANSSCISYGSNTNSKYLRINGGRMYHGTNDNRVYGYTEIGDCFFDETIGKPIWVKGFDGSGNPIWVDATGTPVK